MDKAYFFSRELLNISNIWPFHQHMRDRYPQEDNDRVLKKARVDSPPGPRRKTRRFPWQGRSHLDERIVRR